MKKRLLSLMACGLFAVVSWAQGEWKDITSDYIKNADMSIDMNQQKGWTLVGCTDNGPSQGHNVYGFYAGWGSLERTAGSAKQDITLPAGEYRLEGYAFFRQGLTYDVDPNTSHGKMLAGEESVVLPTLGSVSGLDTYPNDFPQAANAFYSKGLYLSTLNFSLTETKTITVGFECTFDLKQSWMLIGAVKLYRQTTVLNEYNLIREALEALKTEGLNAGLMAKVNATLTETESMTGSDEELNAAILQMQTTKAEVEEVLPQLNEVQEYLTYCEEVMTNSKEKQAGIADAFKAALKACGLAEAVTPEDFTAVQTACKNAHNEYVLNAIPNEGYSLDYTFLIGEEVGNSTNGWVRNFTGFERNYQYNGASNKNNEALGLIKPGYIEAWNNGKAFTGTLTYTKNYLPAGVYTLSAFAFKDASGATVNFTANEQEVALEDAGGLYTKPEITGLEITEGDLTFGLEMVSGATWIGITNVKLLYTGMLGTDNLKATLTAARSALQTAFDAAKENKLIGSAMQTEVTNVLNETAEVANDAVALDLAISKVTGMTELLAATTAVYGTVSQQIADATAIAETSTVDNEEDRTVFTTACTTAAQALDAAISADAINAAGEELEKAYNAFVLVAYPAEGTSFDYTFLMENPSFETGELSPWTAASGGDTGVKANSNGTYTISNADGDYVFNTWGTNDMHVKQTVTNLRDGFYRLTALVAADANSVITLTAGEATANATAIDKGTGVDVSVDKVEVVNGELFVKASSSSWFKADNFRLELVGKALHTEVPEAITPTAGDVESLPIEVVITPSGKYSVINGVHDAEGYVESLNCPAPYLQKKGSEEKIEAVGVSYGEGYDIVFYFMDAEGNPLQAAVGEQYELVIPESLYSCPDNEDDWKNYILSGPQNKEIRCEYTIIEHVAGANIQLFGVDPEPMGEIETAKTFTIAFDQPVTINTAEDAPKVSFMNRFSGQITGTVSAVEGAEHQILVTLEKEVEDQGMYMLNIPEKLVFNAAGDWNTPNTLSYTVTGKQIQTTTYEPTGITPNEGEVTSLKNFIVQFAADTYALTNIDSQEQAYLINNDDQTTVNATLDICDNYNEIKVELAEEVTAKGSYTLIIPAKMIQQGSDMFGSKVLDYAPELKYTFTVGGDGIQAIIADGQTADIYTVNGILVKKAATRQDVKALKKGLYVINGKTVLVK